MVRVFEPSQIKQVIMWLRAEARALAPGKKYSLEIKEHRNKRSLDANAMFWAICTAIAECVRSDKDSIYLMLLERYGVFSTVIAQSEDIPDIAPLHRICNSLGLVTIDGKQWHQLQCFKGSSHYDSKQMARLIDGAISELNEMEIPHDFECEKDRALREWGR